ncbi:MAG: hypothetical protein Q9174_003829 [Haloplaca sp. 1 TL-2023]
MLSKHLLCWSVLPGLISDTLGVEVTIQDCTAADRDPVPECWNILNVTGYLQDWWSLNQATCNSGPYSGDGFASCYQQLVGKGKLLNRACNDISPAPCDAAPDFTTFSPVEYYVLQSIFGIWWWFSSIWYASSTATIVAEAKIGRIVSVINPVKPGDTSLGMILSALSAGFAFINVPAQLGVNVGTQTAAQAITALQQAPGLGKALLPTGSLDSEFKQLANIESAMGDVLSQFQINIANALNASQSDFENFSDLARNGAYIAKHQSLNASTTQLTRVLKTFIVSQALQANNIIMTIAENTNPYEVTRNLSASTSPAAKRNSWHVNCHDEFDDMPYGVCDNWWYDGKDAYSLFNLGRRNENYHDLMIQMFQEGWTTGEELFVGARECLEEIYSVASPSDKEWPWESLSPIVAWSLSIRQVIGFDGQLHINTSNLAATCSSNGRICAWDRTHDPRNRDGRELIEPSVAPSNTSLIPNFDPIRIIQTDAEDYGQPVNWSPCALAFPFQCGWIAQPTSEDEYDIRQSGYADTFPRELTKDCDTPTEENIGWGGAGYIDFRGIRPCKEYPASYIGDALWTYESFCEKPVNGQ